MKVSILDDYFDTLRTLECFAKLADHDVTVWNDHTDDVDGLADRLRDAEVLVLIRERTRIGALASDLHPGSPSFSTAELTWGLVIAAMRRIPQQVAAMVESDRRGGPA